MASRTHVLIALAGLLLVGDAISAHAAARPYIFGCGRYRASWAGRPRSYDLQLFDHMVNIGVTMTGAGLPWCDGEPVQGQYDWDAIDYADFQVNEILARGMEPTFFLGLTPQWAALRPDLEPHRTPPSEGYVDEFMDFHRFVANRYKGKVKYYFFWNEPNGCSWINDGCSNGDSYPLYTQWLIRCSQAVKSVDPAAKIIAGNLDYHAGVSHGYLYVQGMYDYGAGPYIDGIAIHPYDWAGTIHWRAVTDTRNVMVANGDAHKGIWLTEYGWNSGSESDLANRITSVLTELKKPEWDFVVQANYLVLNDGSGVENYGLMDANLNPRQRYYAFRDFDKTFPSYVDFSANVTEGPAPLTVQFTDESNVLGAYQWYWEFGDGLTSSGQNPSHTYTQDGLYTVRLTVTGTGGPDMAEKADYIRVGTFPPVPGVDNPSFEENGGSYDGWQIVHVSGEWPDNPPLDNSNPWGPTTPFGSHFGGKITNGLSMDFYLGQVVGTTDWDPSATEAEWQLSAWVQLRSTQAGDPNPTGVHQVWEIGWNSDGSEPAGIMTCDNYQVVASIDGTYTGNDAVTFYELAASGAITGVTGLRGVAVRAHLYTDGVYWWSFDNIDNLNFAVTSVESPDVVSTPPGFYGIGWNMTGVPVQPTNPDASAVFHDLVSLGNVITNNLYRYEPGVGYAMYPLHFSNVSRGLGYWLWVATTGPSTVVSVAGEIATTDVQLPLLQGWNLIGHPFPQPVLLSTCQVTNGTTTVSFDNAVAAAWIMGALYYWEPAGGYRVLRSAGFGHDDSLRPWRGYWIRTNTPELRLIVPRPT